MMECMVAHRQAGVLEKFLRATFWSTGSREKEGVREGGKEGKRGGGREGERKGGRETDRQTDRQTDRKGEMQSRRETERQRERQREREREREEGLDLVLAFEISKPKPHQHTSFYKDIPTPIRTGLLISPNISSICMQMYKPMGDITIQTTTHGYHCSSLSFFSVCIYSSNHSLQHCPPSFM